VRVSGQRHEQYVAMVDIEALEAQRCMGAELAHLLAHSQDSGGSSAARVLLFYCIDYLCGHSGRGAVR